MKAELHDILSGLQETQEAITNVENAARQSPNRASLAMSLDSLHKRHAELERRFQSLARSEERDVCSYRLFQDADFRPLISAVGTTLTNFQSWVSVVYDAIKYGPKKRAKIAADAAADTAFAFGYSYAGSLGIVMTLPNERLLLGETNIDRAIETVFQMARAESSDQIAYYAKTFGAAAIRQMFRWASDHVTAGMGADIDWRRDEQVRAHLFVEPPHLANLVRAITETSDEEQELIKIQGVLVAMDAKSHRFKFEVEDADDVRGEASEYVATMGHTVELPKRYAAEIRKTTRINYATDQEETEYYLVNLIEPE